MSLLADKSAQKSFTVKEYDDLAKKSGLTPADHEDLREFALAHLYDDNSKYRPVLKLDNQKILAQNYVGILTTSQKKVIEILPKVELAGDEQGMRQVFFNMLRSYMGNPRVLTRSQINQIQRYTMLEAFVRLFLDTILLITKRGLAHQYETVTENLPYFKGKLLFSQHITRNLADQSRFFVEYDQFIANRPVNRLIHSALNRLSRVCRDSSNIQLARRLETCFADIPLSRHYQQDWEQHKLDRTMQHYDQAMPWVGLFLLGHGLATFSGKHDNVSLLFPMEQVFEAFVADSFKRYAGAYSVRAQGPGKYLAEGASENIGYMRPDLHLQPVKGGAPFILDTKWKQPDKSLNSGDLYQVYAYGKKYGCRKVALVYPKATACDVPRSYRFDSDLSFEWLYFDVTEPQESVHEILGRLENHSGQSFSSAR